MGKYGQIAGVVECTDRTVRFHIGPILVFIVLLRRYGRYLIFTFF